VPRLTEPTLAGWTPVERFVNWKPIYQAPKAELQRSYLDSAGASAGAGAGAASQPVGIYVAYYRHQGGDSKLVNSQNLLARGNDPVWSQVGGSTQAIKVDGQTLTVRSARLRAQKGGEQAVDQRLLVWQMYWVDGQLTSSDMVAKLRGAKQRLFGGGDDAAALLLYTEDDGTPASTAVLEAFARKHLGAITAQLAKARRGE